MCLCVEQRLCKGGENGELEDRKHATDGNNRVATGVLNFVRTNTGMIICLLSAPIMNRSVQQSCRPSYASDLDGEQLLR